MSTRKYGVLPVFGWRQVVLLIASPGPAMLAIAEGHEVEVVISVALVTFGIVGLLNVTEPPAFAQQPQPIKRTPLQKFDVPGAQLITRLGAWVSVAADVHVGRDLGDADHRFVVGEPPWTHRPTCGVIPEDSQVLSPTTPVGHRSIAATVLDPGPCRTPRRLCAGSAGRRARASRPWSRHADHACQRSHVR